MSDSIFTSPPLDRALRTLRNGLITWITPRLETTYGSEWLSEINVKLEADAQKQKRPFQSLQTDTRDVKDWLLLLEKEWHDTFKHDLQANGLNVYTGLHYIRGLQSVRNSLYHHQAFSIERVELSLAMIRALLLPMNVPEIQEIKQLQQQFYVQIGTLKPGLPHRDERPSYLSNADWAQTQLTLALRCLSTGIPQFLEPYFVDTYGPGWKTTVAKAIEKRLHKKIHLKTSDLSGWLFLLDKCWKSDVQSHLSLHSLDARYYYNLVQNLQQINRQLHTNTWTPGQAMMGMCMVRELLMVLHMPEADKALHLINGYRPSVFDPYTPPWEDPDVETVIEEPPTLPLFDGSADAPYFPQQIDSQATTIIFADPDNKEPGMKPDNEEVPIEPAEDEDSPLEDPVITSYVHLKREKSRSPADVRQAILHDLERVLSAYPLALTSFDWTCTIHVLYEGSQEKIRLESMLGTRYFIDEIRHHLSRGGLDQAVLADYRMQIEPVLTLPPEIVLSSEDIRRVKQQGIYIELQEKEHPYTYQIRVLQGEIDKASPNILVLEREPEQKVTIGRLHKIIKGNRMVRINRIAFAHIQEQADVSRRQAHIKYNTLSQRFEIKDDGSTQKNTYLLREGESETVTVGGFYRPLYEGDQIHIGEHVTLIFESRPDHTPS